jgi:catechol 2,3-dioxygenase-like lactoylglutathione lyase family enzyme
LSPDEDRLPALDHVQVAAPSGCEAHARRFYGDLLGLTEIEKPTALARRGGVWFALASGAQLHVGVAEAFTPALKAHPGLRVPGVDVLEQLARRLAGAGVAVAWDDELPGVRRFFTADPWGNRLEVLAVG